MEHVIFFIFNILAVALLFILDKKNQKKYLMLSGFTLILAFIFENVTTYLGFWHYHAEPKILFISLYPFLMYTTYICFSYYIGNKLGGKK